MSWITIIFISFGLAMDAFAVSITSGMAIKPLRFGSALKIALFFGFFQALMPIIGWLAGVSLRGFISDIDHWLAFGLLCFIGSKMIYESFKLETSEKSNPLDIYVIFILSIATSIDALAVGITFAFLNVSIITPVLAIGIVTFLVSFFGVFVGEKFGHFFEKKIEIVGGIILIGIGIKILVEHLYFQG